MLSQSHYFTRTRTASLAARHIAPAVVAAVALLASACSAEEPPAPAAAEETATTITTAPANTAAPDAAPAAPEPAAEPDAAPVDFVAPEPAPETEPEPTTTEPEPAPETEPESEAVPEPDQEADSGSDEPELAASQVVCGEGLVLIEELATDTDNGCRAETCEHGRADHGHCDLPDDEELTEEEAVELADAEPLTWEEYGLEGCTEISPGICDKDGVRHCHDTITGWAECPGQSSGDICEHDPNDPYSFTGSTQTLGDPLTVVTLERGTWDVTVCLVDNDVQTGQPAPFVAHLMEIPEEGRQRQVWIPLLEVTEPVTAGQWTVEQALPAPVFDALGIEQLIFQIAMTPEGGGTWAVRFTKLD